MVSLAICFTVKILPIITIILYFSVSRFACVSNVELEHYSAHCKPTKLKICLLPENIRVFIVQIPHFVLLLSQGVSPLESRSH